MNVNIAGPLLKTQLEFNFIYNKSTLPLSKIKNTNVRISYCNFTFPSIFPPKNYDYFASKCHYTKLTKIYPAYKVQYPETAK